MKDLVLLFLALALVVPASSQNSIQKGDMHRDMRNYADAVKTYKKAFEKAPDNTMIPVEIARCYVQLQDYFQASQWFEKVIETEGIAPSVYLEYAHVLKSLRLYAKAKFYYQKYGDHDRETANHFVASCDFARITIGAEPTAEVTPTGVNTPETEFAPCPKGKRIVFSSLSPSGSKSRSTKDGSMSMKTGSALFMADQTMTRTSISNMDGITDDGATISHFRKARNADWIVFMKSELQNGQRLFDDRPGKMSIMTGTMDASGSIAEVAPFPFNSNDYATGYPCLSDDGTVLYFASTRPGGFGGWDLYVSFRGLDGWTTPQNLGATINTPGNEIAPFYRDQQLFFSSDWHEGLGGFDIFMASSTNGQWTHVANMGFPVNTPKDDIDFVLADSPKTGFFATNRIGVTGQYDIFRYTSTAKEIELIVMDQDGKKGVDGVTISSPEGEFAPVVTDVNGVASLVIPNGYNGEVMFTHSGYEELKMNLKGDNERINKYEVFIDRSLQKEETEQTIADNFDAMSQPVAEGTQGATDNSKKSTVSEPVSNNMTTSQTGQQENSRTEPASPPAEADMVKTEVVTKVKTVVVGSPEKTSGTVSRPDEPLTEPEPVRPIGKYAVQVAAVGKQGMLDKYSDLQRHGQVMQYPENGMYKIRVGYFKTDLEAKSALAKIRASGYPDAFLVTMNPVKETRASEDSEQAADAAPIASTPANEFMVRLGTYSRPEFFDASKVQHLGKVESRKSGEYTIMLLSGFASAEAAEIAKVEAAGAGFNDAYVVRDDSGNLTRVR